MEPGNLLSTHHGRVLGGKGFLGTLAALILGLAITAFGISGEARNTGTAVAIGLGFLGIGVALGAWQLKLSRKRVEVYDRGFTFSDGGAPIVVAWHQLRGARVMVRRIAGGPLGLGATRQQAASYVLLTDRGELMVDENLSAFDHLRGILDSRLR